MRDFFRKNKIVILTPIIILSALLIMLFVMSDAQTFLPFLYALF